MPLSAYSSDDVDVHSALPHDPLPPPEAPSTGFTGLSAYSSDDTGKGDTGPSTASTASGYVSQGGGETYGDWAQSLKAGIHGAGAALSTLAAHTQPSEDTKYYEEQAQHYREDVGKDVQGMTPAGQQGREGSFWSHPVQQTLEQAPALAVQAGPAIIGGMTLGAPGAIAGAALGGATLGPQMASEFAGRVMAAPEEDLMKNADYASNIANGMTPRDARLQFAQDHSGDVMAQGAVVGALTSLPFAEVGGAGASKILGDKLVTKVLTGGLESGTVMGVQGAGQADVSEGAAAKANLRPPVTGADEAGAAWEGFKTGLQWGVGGALLHRGAQPGQSGTSIRSSRDSGKQAKEQATAAEEAAKSGAAGAPPSGAREPDKIIDPDIAAAAKGEPIVTPGSNQQAGAVEQPAPVVQPTDVGAAEATGAPPAGITPVAPSPPTEVAEAAPAPAPAPANAPAPEVVAPEPQATLQAQHQDLLDKSNTRQLVVYNPGEEPLPLPKNQGFATTTLPDTRVAQYWRYGPDKLTAAKLASTTPDDLNKFLQSSTVNKNEAVDMSVAGVGEPAVVTTRRPDGTEVKAGATTTAVAPDDVALHEATKAPGDTVQVETPEQTIAERFAKQREENVAAQAAPPPDPLANAERVGRNERTGMELYRTEDGRYLGRNKAGVVGAPLEEVNARRLFPEMFPREATQEVAPVTQQSNVPIDMSRVKRAEDAIEKETQARQAVAQEAVKGVTTQEEAAPTGKNWTKGELAKKEGANQAANEIMQAERNHPKSGEQPNEILARAKGIVAEAKGIHVPTEISEEGKHGPGMMLLREAKDLVAKDLPKQNKFPSMADYARFLDREAMIRRGEFAEALEARRNEGKEASALGAPAEVKAEGVRPGEGGEHLAERSAEEEVIHREEEEERAKEEPEGGVQAEARERPKVVEEVKEGEHYTTPKAVAAFKQEKTRPKWKKQEGEGEEVKTEAEYDAEARARSEAWAAKRREEKAGPSIEIGGVTVRPSRTETATDAIKRTYGVGKYATGAPQIMGKLRGIVEKIAGDTPVHYITDAEMNKIMNFTGDGHVHGAFSDTGLDGKPVILLNSEHMSDDTPLHEAFHAATVYAINRNADLRQMMERLRIETLMSKEVSNLNAKDRAEIDYYFTNHEEFLTGMMTNPKMQELLKGVKISKELAEALGIPKWRKMTMWEGALSVIRQVLGLGPRDTSAIEAAMSLSEQLIWRDPRGTGDLLEATGRAAQKDMRGWKLQVAPEREHIADGEKLDGAFTKLVPQVVKNITGDAQTNVKYWWQKGRQYLLSPTQIAGLHRGIFKGRLDDLNHALEAQHQHRAQLNEADRSFLAKSYQLAKQFPQHMNDFGRLLDMSSKYGIHADQDAPKEPKNLPNGAMENWQAVKFGPEARELLETIRGAAPELAAHYTELKEFYKDKATALGRAHLERIMDIFDPIKGTMAEATERNERYNRVMNHEMTPEDRARFKELGVLPELDKAYGFMNRKGVYFNAYRDGDHVITGRYDMPAGGQQKSYSGELLPDNVREFDTRDEAHEYATNTEMHATPDIVRYAEDPKNKGKFLTYIEAEDGRKLPVGKEDAAATKFRVTLQREHTEMHRSAAQAERAREEMIKLGVKDVSAVLDKRIEKNWSRITSADAASFERKIKDRSDLSPTEQNATIQASRQISLMAQSGNRLNRYWTTRRNIAGANFNEVYEAAHNYSNASNFHVAQSKALPDIDAAMKGLDDFEQENRNDKDNGYLISAITNTMKDHVFAGPDSISPKTPGWLRALTTLSFAKYLLTPRFIVQHQLHPLAFTAPQMTGRHGYINSVGYLRRALSDVGGNIPNIGTGLHAGYDMAKGLMGFGDMEAKIAAGKPLNMMDRIIARVGAKNSREGEAMSTLQKWGAMSSGFDDEFYGSSGLDKVNLMMRQMTGAMEATNRSVAGLASYRAEYDKQIGLGKNSQVAHEAAIDYAYKTISSSMGIFSPTNMAQMFKQPYLRAAMQFKQFPIQQTYAFLRNVHEAFKGESAEVRKEAARSAISQLTSASIMTGIHGAPLLGVLKAGGLLTSAMGITPLPSQIDDRIRRTLADNTSSGFANAIFDGALSTLGPYAPDVSSMFGYNADFFYGEPHNNDWKSYLWDTAVGAPGSGVTDTWSGIHNMYEGNFAKGAAQLSPIGLLSNFARAYTMGTEGAQTTQGLQIMPASPEAAAWKMLGITTQQQARAYAGRDVLEQDMYDDKMKKQSALDSARRGDMSAYIKWNAANPQDRISQSQVQQAKKGMSAQSILGVKVSPKNRARLQEFGSAYQ